METTNWFEVGKDAAENDLSRLVNNEKSEITECPWPIYSPEGVEWLRGWNSVSRNDAELMDRPDNHGNLFVASENR